MDPAEEFLHCAGRGLQYRMQELIHEGVDVNVTSALGTTALMIAAANGLNYIVGMLLGNNADTKMTNITGMTALDYAIAGHHLDTAALFPEYQKTHALRVGKQALERLRRGSGNVRSRMI